MTDPRRSTAPRHWVLDGAAGWQPLLYELFFTRTRWGRSLRAAEERPIAALLGPRATAGTSVLEFGAGTGTYTAMMVRGGARVEVREPSPTMRRYLARRARRSAWPVDILDGALPHRARTGRTYDLVIAVGVLNYVADLTHALITMAHVVGLDGVVLANVPTDRRAGARYRRIEFLGRRRIHRRSAHEVAQAARRAGLDVIVGPVPAGVTDVYLLAPER